MVRLRALWKRAVGGGESGVSGRKHQTDVVHMMRGGSLKGYWWLVTDISFSQLFQALISLSLVKVKGATTLLNSLLYFNQMNEAPLEHNHSKQHNMCNTLWSFNFTGTLRALKKINSEVFNIASPGAFMHHNTHKLSSTSCCLSVDTVEETEENFILASKKIWTSQNWYCNKHYPRYPYISIYKCCTITKALQKLSKTTWYEVGLINYCSQDTKLTS